MSSPFPGMQPEDQEPGGPAFGQPQRVGQTRQQRMERIQGLIDNFTFSLGSGMAAAAEAHGGPRNRTMAGTAAALQAPAFLEQARQKQAMQQQEMAMRQAQLQEMLKPKQPSAPVPGRDIPFSDEVTANKIAIAHPSAAPKAPEKRQKIDEFTNPSGKRVYAMQEPDGKITYEEGPEVQQPKENTPRPTDSELDFQDYQKHPELTTKYGSDRIGFDKYKQAQGIERTNATKTPPDPGLKDLRIETRVDNIRNQYNAHPVVRQYNAVQNAVQFAKGLDPKTKNPADDQALIYAFAKAMDPDSVVREGEYATIQKYSQSWAEKFGFDAKRIFSNTTFLTETARRNMKATIENRALPIQQQYSTVRKDFVGRIQQVTGKDGNEYIPDYGAAFDEPKKDEPKKSLVESPIPPPPSNGGQNIIRDSSGRMNPHK